MWNAAGIRANTCSGTHGPSMCQASSVVDAVDGDTDHTNRGLCTWGLCSSGAIQITTNAAQGKGSSPKLVLNGVLC